MGREYRAIVREGGREVPFWYIFKKPDVNWGGYFHNLRANQVVRWESHEVRSDGSATAWSPAARKAERRCICNDETGEYCDSDSSPLADDVAPADPKDEQR